MDQAEYDRLHRRPVKKILDEEPIQTMMEDNGAALPVNIKIINSTPQERYEKEMQRLHEGGADYNGNEQWRALMCRFGRIR